MAIKLKTRRPTGVVPWPLILIEGDEGAGKTYSAAEFSASGLIGQMFWVDLAEGSADEYAAIEGADYEIIDHDGSYRDIFEQIQAVHAEARRAAVADEPPVVLTIDSGSQLWRMLKNWTHERARRGKANAQRLEADPDAVFDVGMNLWNDATERWAAVIHLLQTSPASPSSPRAASRSPRLTTTASRSRTGAASSRSGRSVPRRTWPSIAPCGSGCSAASPRRSSRPAPCACASKRASP
jgi:hypothetical protein